MKQLLVSLLVWIGFTHLAFSDFNSSYEPNDWQEHTIKFSHEGTLTDIFNSGIQPYRFPSLERSCLEFKHVKVFIEFESSEKIPMLEVEYGEITPLLGGLLANIKMKSSKLSVTKAELMMGRFLPKGKRTKDQLNHFLSLAARDPRNYENPYDDDADGFTITWCDPKGLNYYVGFKSTFDPSTPVRFVFGISWDSPIRTPLQKRSFYDIPIPPPPGYENVSMEAPRNFGPDSAVEIARSKGLPITGDRTSEEYEKQWHEANDKTRSPKPKLQAVERKLKFPEGPTIWIWLIGLFSLTTAVWLAPRWRLKSTF